MSYSYGKSIVTDGLAFYVDAGNGNSYDAATGGATFTGLVGGLNATLTNMDTSPSSGSYDYSSANGGSLAFDGANDYATLGYSLPAQSSSTTFTWNLWIYLPSGNDDDYVIFGNRYGPANLQFIKITPTNWEYYNGGAENISYSIPTNQWINLCVVKNQGTHYYYSNASQVGTRSSNKSIVANPVFMGADAYSGVKEPSSVQFASAAIYDRALSASEVTQNYNALKNRFV